VSADNLAILFFNSSIIDQACWFVNLHCNTTAYCVNFPLSCFYNTDGLLFTLFMFKMIMKLGIEAISGNFLKMSIVANANPGKKVKGFLQEFRRGAHLFSLDHWTCKRIFWYAWPVLHQTYGYLPSQRPVHLPLSSFPTPQRVGGWVGLYGWLHAKTVCPWRSPTPVLTGFDRGLCWCDKYYYH